MKYLESYDNHINRKNSEPLNPELFACFEKYNKLSGDRNRDIRFVNEFSLLLEKEEFDPYAHLTQNDVIDDSDCVLSFGDQNEKMKKLGIVYFSLPAGYTCPFADVCKTFAHKDGGKFASTGTSIKDDGDIRCYAANSEVLFKNVRNNRWQNFDLLKPHKNDADALAEIINRSIKYYQYEEKAIQIMRIHESGDFFSQAYFDAWMKAAQAHPHILFYAYTKAIRFAVNRESEMPKNFRIIGSFGGTQDDLLMNSNLRKAFILKTEQEAIAKGLPIDINDFLAIAGESDFALLLHGTQSAASGNSNIGRENSKNLKDKATKFSVDRKSLLRAISKFIS